MNKPKKKIKDSVFTHLFADKKYIAQLYMALHPEEKNITEDMIKIVTLEPVLVDKIYNDLGFMVGDKLIILVEAQSTWSPNIIIRSFLYLAHTYQEYIDNNNLPVYQPRKVEIPRSELYVIYTGDKYVGKDTIKLSEEYFDGKETALDVTVKVITDATQANIIGEYVSFAKVFDSQMKEYGRTEKAISETLRICKDKNILNEYLSVHEKEVQDIMFALYDNEKQFDLYVQAEKKRVAAQTKQAEKISTIKNAVNKGLPYDMIAEIVSLPVDKVKELAKA